MEGIELVRAVIEAVRSKGFHATFGAVRDREPQPVSADALEQFRFEGDIPLTPCLKEWLAFDGGLFSWFGGPWAGQPLGALVAEQFGEPSYFEVFERVLSRRCYPLPFNDNAEQVDFLYPSAPDTTGELPVLSAESENGYVLVGYPGIDVYLGHRARLLGQDSFKDWRAAYEARYAVHREQTLQGRQVLQLGEDELVPELPEEEGLPKGVTKLDARNYGIVGDGPVPAGFRVVRTGSNPYTNETFRVLERES